MIKVKLLGELGRTFGREWDLDISTPAEAIRAIGYQVPEFIGYLNNSSDNGVAYKVITGMETSGLDEEGLQLPAKDLIIIAPIIMGAGAVGKIVLGVVLVAAAFMIPGGIGIAGMAISSGMMGTMGAALILGGISSMLSPTPRKTKDKKGAADSSIIDRAGDVIDQGSPVPTAYGQQIMQDLIVLSSGIIEETMNESVEQSIANPLYKRVTQVQLPYKAVAVDKYSYHYSTRTYRALNIDMITNRDPYSGCVVDKVPFNRLAIQITFSTAPNGLNVAAAYPIQRIRLYAGTLDHWGASGFKVYAGTGEQLLFSRTGIANRTFLDYDLSNEPQFNVARSMYTIEFFQADPLLSYIAIGELELFGAIGLDENLAAIKA